MLWPLFQLHQPAQGTAVRGHATQTVAGFRRIGHQAATAQVRAQPSGGSSGKDSWEHDSCGMLMRNEKRYCNLKPAGCLLCCHPVWVSQQLVFLRRPRFSSAETRPPPEISF